MDIREELQKIKRLNGDTYSSAEVIGLVGRADAEIERLRVALTRIDNESECDHAAEIAQEALAYEQSKDAKP